MSFQDELISLLRGFSISTIDDFTSMDHTEKHYLVSRLYACFKSGVKRLGSELQPLRGLKLHYSRDAREPGVVRPEYEPTFYKKLVLYSIGCVVSCPILEATSLVSAARKKRQKGLVRFDSAALRQLRKEGNYVFGSTKSERGTYGPEVHASKGFLIVSRSQLLELISTILDLREAIEEKVVYVLPALPTSRGKLRASLRQAGATSANFHREDLVHQMTEDYLADAPEHVNRDFLNVYLPHLTGVPMKGILEVRNEMIEAYLQFQIAIDRFLAEAAEALHDSEARIAALLREIDEAVRQIHGRLKDIRRRLVWKNAEVAIGLVPLSVIAFHIPALADTLAGVLASLAAIDAVAGNSELIREYSKVRLHPFYIAAKLSHPT